MSVQPRKKGRYDFATIAEANVTLAGHPTEQEPEDSLPAAQPVNQERRAAQRAAEDAIAGSIWSTEHLTSMALRLQSYDDYTQPVWAQIAGTQAEAREYYDELTVDHPDQARAEAAEALAKTGWTVPSLGLKTS